MKLRTDSIEMVFEPDTKPVGIVRMAQAHLVRIRILTKGIHIGNLFMLEVDDN